MAGEQQHPEPPQHEDQERAQRDSGGLESFEVDDQRWETDASREQPGLGERIARGEVPPPVHESVEHAYPQRASGADESEADQEADAPDQERRDEQAMPTAAAATKGERRALARQGGPMHATDTDQQAPRVRQQRTKQQPQEQQAAPTTRTSEAASSAADASEETRKRGRTRKSAAQSEDTGEGRHEGDTMAEQPPRPRASTRAAKAPASQEQPETPAAVAAANGEAAEQSAPQPEGPQPPQASGGGVGVAEETLQREEPELQPSGQPVGVQLPTSANAGALRDARIRVGNVIDRFASQIPYGQQFADEAKRAANQALDHLEAQAARRAASLHRDLGAAPGETPGAPA